MESALADARMHHGLRFHGRSATCTSWARLLFGSGGLWALTAQRIAHGTEAWRPTGPPGALGKHLLRACSDVANFACHVLFKIDLLRTTEVEPGVYVADEGHVIAGAQHIGAGTLIHGRVTIGRQPMQAGLPVIGRDVWIGPDCVIYGDIEVGDGATLLPRSVVTRTLPPATVAAGNPAQVVARNFDNSALRGTLSTDAEHLLPDLRSR